MYHVLVNRIPRGMVSRNPHPLGCKLFENNFQRGIDGTDKNVQKNKEL